MGSKVSSARKYDAANDGEAADKAQPEARPEPEPEPEQPPELQPEPEPEREPPPSLERRSGWLDVEIPPLEKELDPEWITYWFRQMDAVLQVFETDPATATVRSRSLFGKAPQASPKFEFALDECVVETIPRGVMPDGRGSTFLLRKRDPDEDEARAAALDDAFAAPSGADAAKQPKTNKKKDKAEKDRAAERAEKADKAGDKKDRRRRSHRSGHRSGHRSRSKGDRGKKRSKRPEQQDQKKSQAKSKAKASSAQSKAAAAKERARAKKEERRAKAKAKKLAAEEAAAAELGEDAEAAAEIPTELKSKRRPAAPLPCPRWPLNGGLAVPVDPGSKEEQWWWMRSLYEGGAHVPEFVEDRLKQMYRDEERERVDAARRAWRHHLTRMSRAVPRCVLGVHTLEDDVVAVAEPKMEIFDAALAQVHFSGVARLVENENLRRLHSELFAAVLECIAAHGGDVVAMTGDALLVMWGLHRGWGRQDPDKLKRDTLRACQCMVDLRARVIGADAAKDAVWSGAHFETKCAVSAGPVSALWLGGHQRQRQVVLKGAALLTLRSAAAAAQHGQIALSEEALALCEDGVRVEGELEGGGGDVLESIVPRTEDDLATPVIPLEPLCTVTQNSKLTADIAKLEAKRTELLADLRKIEEESTGFELEGSAELGFAQHPDAIADFDAVMKKISKFRSLTKERFLDALLAHLKSQANADFELIRKYEKARRFMEDDLDEDKIAGFRSQHWKEWDRWRDEVVEVLEDEQRAERSCSPAAQGDGEGDELLEPPPIEASEREIYDQGTRELLLQSMAERVVTLAEEVRRKDQEHEQWQRPVLNVLAEYIPPFAKPYVRGREDARQLRVSVVVIRLPEQDFSLAAKGSQVAQEDDDELKRTALTEAHSLMLCLQQLAERFGADLRELVSSEQATLVSLTVEESKTPHHCKVALVAALAVRDCLRQMNLAPAISVTSGDVYETLVGDFQGSRCQLASIGSIIDTAILLLRSAAALPGDLGGVLCDDVTRNGAVASQAALPGGGPGCTRVWSMRLVFDAVGRITVQDEKRLRAYVPRRFEEWAGAYLLRCRAFPFHPHVPADVVGRDDEVTQICDQLGSDNHETNRVYVEGAAGLGKTAVAAAVYEALYRRGSICVAGRAAQDKQHVPYFALYQAVAALLVCAARPDQSPGLPADSPDDAGADGAPEARWIGVKPWWLDGAACADSCVLLDEAVQCLPPDLQALFPAIRLMLPLLEIPETEATEPLDGKTRATATNRFIVDLLQLVLQRSSRRLCIMIDDAQWLDHSSQLLIRQILRKAPAVAWYFNCSAPDGQTSRFCKALRKNPKVHVRQLPPLLPEFTLALAERQCRDMGAEQLEPETAEYLRGLPGIPLHTIHFTKSLFEADDIIVSQGVARAGPRLTEPEQHGPVPHNVRDIIQERLDALPSERRALLLFPSALSEGESGFTPTLSVALAERYAGWDRGTPMVSNLHHYEALCAAGFLARSEPHLETLLFSGAAVRDLAHGSLSAEDQASLRGQKVGRCEAQHRHAKRDLQAELDQLFEKTDEPFCMGDDVVRIKEGSYMLGQADLDHAAWTSGAEFGSGDLVGKRVFVAGVGFGQVTKSQGSISGGCSADVLLDGADAAERLALGGRDGAAFQVLDDAAVSSSAEGAVEAARTQYRECLEVSPHFQTVADAQLQHLSGFEEARWPSAEHVGLDEEPHQLVLTLPAAVANLYQSITQMARDGALVEASACVCRALELFEWLPDREQPERKQQELELNGIFHRNWLAEDVSVLYEGVRPKHIERMRVLSDELGIVEYAIPIMVCEWLMEFYAKKRSLHTCVRLARACMTTAADTSPEVVLEANRMLYMVHAHKGEWHETIRLCRCVVGEDGQEAGDRHYSAARHHENTYRYAGTDPGVFTWNTLATAYARVGEVDRALGAVAQAHELAVSLDHPLTLALMYSTHLALLWDLKLFDSIEELAPEVEEFCDEQGYERLMLLLRCAAAEADPSQIREVYDEAMKTAEELVAKESWATNQLYVGPLLRLCQLAGEYGKGLALAVEIWTESEIDVGRFQSEAWCAWLPDIYGCIGQFKLMQADQEDMPHMTAEERTAWREDVWAEGLRFLAQSVVASRFAGASFGELRALMRLHRALEATKLAGALRPREWMNDLDPTILNIICVGDRMRALYDTMDGLADVPDAADAHSMLAKIEAESSAAGKSKSKLRALKSATKRGIEEVRQAQDAEKARATRTAALWSKGKASAASLVVEEQVRRLQESLEAAQAVEASARRDYSASKSKYEAAESMCKIEGWVHREKEKFGDFSSAYASLAAGKLTWLKAGDADKPIGSAELQQCEVAPVEKRRRKHPDAFELVLSVPDSAGAEKYVLEPKEVDNTATWMECIERNSSYADVLALRERMDQARQAHVAAKTESRQAKQAVKARRGDALAQVVSIDLQLAKELAPPEPEPEPTEGAEEAAVDLDAPPVDRQVTVVGAEGLLQADGLLGASDPYAVVTFGGVEVGRTDVLEDTLDPRWDSRFLMSVPPAGGVLRVEVYDHDVASAHDFLGEAEVQLRRGSEATPFSLPVHSYPLKPSARNPGKAVRGSITFSVEQEDEVEQGPPVIGVLRITVREAANLPKMDSLSHTDAYVQLEVEEAVAATKTIRDTESPKFNEEFIFDLHSDETTCTLRLYDHDPVDVDDVIGEVQIPFEQLHGEPRSEWFAIQQVAGGPGGDLGELQLEIDYRETFGQDHGAGTLSATVVECAALKKMDLVGKNDVYVTCGLGRDGAPTHTKRTTTIAGGGSSPRWRGGKGETLEFEDVRPDGAVVFQAWDEDRGSDDDLIGQCRVDLAELVGSQGFLDTWRDLAPEDGGTITGRMRVVVAWREG